MSLALPQNGDVEVDLRAVFRAVRRKLPIIVILCLLVGAGVYYLMSKMEPSYTAQTNLLIESGQPDLSDDTPDQQAAALQLDTQGIASQVQLIRSRDIAQSVIAELGIATHPDFDPTQQEPGLIDSLLAKVGLGGDDEDAAPAPTDEIVLSEFLGRLSVSPIDQTRVIVISFSSTDPQLAADVVNAVARRYIAMQATNLQSVTAEATQWLRDQIDILQQRVRTAEADVASFRSQAGLIEIGPNNVTLAEQQLTDISTALSAQRTARVDAEARAAQIRAQIQDGDELSASEVLSSPLIQNLRQQQASLRTQIAEATATLLPAHPRFREFTAQMADLETDIREEAERILSSIENEAALARARENELAAEYELLRAEVAQSNADEVELNALVRVAENDNATLDLYLQRYREAATRLDTAYAPVNVRVVSQAAAPIEPDSASSIVFAVGAMVIFFVLGAAILLVRELSSGRATRPVLRNAVMPIPMVPGAMPVDGRLRWSDDGDVRRMMPYDPGSASALASQVERSLAAIAAQIRGRQARRILITVADGTSDRGRPLAAVALARTLARTGARVLLVDLHHDEADRIAMGERDGLPGFGDLFAGEASFAQVIFRDRNSPAHFISAGNLPADGLGGDRLATILGALDHTYDHVVYDIGSDLVPALGPSAGAAIVVTEVGPADPRTVRAYDAVTAVSTADVMLLVTDPVPAGPVIAAIADAAAEAAAASRKADAAA